MQTFKKVFCVALALVMVLSLAACGEKKEEKPAEVKYERGDDETVYEATLGSYEELMTAAKEAADDDERFVLYAQAEAALLDSAVFLPTTTQGGAYTISRIAYRTTPYVNWGNDDDRWKSMVVSADLITKEERADLKAMWEAAVKGEADYDAEGYLRSKGHEILKDYVYSFSTAPVTLDSLNTSSQSDTEILVNTVDNLVEYNNLGQMIPALAESWEVSDDGLTYTFHLRNDAHWYTSEGTEYAQVTAEDFCAGFQHMLDAEAGLEWLVDGIVAGAGDYLYNGGSWDNVGYKALDAQTLQITLEKPASYFMTMLTYSCFNPICKSFYESRGGVFGREAYAEAQADTEKYTYGKITDVSSQVYNGAFLLTNFNDKEIKVVRNTGYYAPESQQLDSITWVYDSGENPVQYYNDVVAGTFAGCALTTSSGTLDMAKADGNFDKYAYVSDTTSTTYFGGLNLNRGTFALESGTVASPKTEQQKIDTNTALNNKNFRKAVLFAFDKAAYNAVREGEELATTKLRNMYTHPEFVQLSKDVTDAEGHTFPAGTMYGEMVQYYCDALGTGITVADGVNGWYNPDLAKSALEAAKAELGDTVTFPIGIDVVYYSANVVNTAQAQAVKQVIEAALGAENVTINLVEATTSEDYYASGYRASNGEAGNFDFFYGSGWGPDFGDPCTYLDTFLGNGAGYMTKVIGLF